MVISKTSKIAVTIIFLLSILNIFLAGEDWKYYTFFDSDKLVIDERVEDDVCDVVKGFYRRDVPLHQISKQSFMVSIDDCMSPFIWGIARGAPISNQVHIYLNKDLVLFDKEFRQWVIAHELAHEFGFIHEDSLLIMGQYNKRNSLEDAMDELAIEIHKKNVQ